MFENTLFTTPSIRESVNENYKTLGYKILAVGFTQSEVEPFSLKK